jgi:hypothetical protein
MANATHATVGPDLLAQRHLKGGMVKPDHTTSRLLGAGTTVVFETRDANSARWAPGSGVQPATF